MDNHIQLIWRVRHIPFRADEPIVLTGIGDVGPQSVPLGWPVCPFGADAKAVFQGAVGMHLGKRDEVAAIPGIDKAIAGSIELPANLFRYRWQKLNRTHQVMQLLNSLRPMQKY